MDSFTQPAGRTPNPVARPPLDDAGAQNGIPPKAIKTQIRLMQPLSCLILDRAVGALRGVVGMLAPRPHQHGSG